MDKNVRQSYSKRASEYVAALGDVDYMDPLDVNLITSWGMSVNGSLLDAGSGPGHWTELLRSSDCDVSGLDMVSEFVESARHRFPYATFRTGNILNMPFESSSFGGVLAWYSLIHMTPKERDAALKEFARVLKPAGTLLVGAFLGEQDIPFDHAITQAFYWSENGLGTDLESAGFQVISIDTRVREGSRPHISGLARLPEGKRFTAELSNPRSSS